MIPLDTPTPTPTGTHMLVLLQAHEVILSVHGTAREAKSEAWNNWCQAKCQAQL